MGTQLDHLSNNLSHTLKIYEATSRRGLLLGNSLPPLVPETLPLVVYSFGWFVALIPIDGSGDEVTAYPGNLVWMKVFFLPPPIELWLIFQSSAQMSLSTGTYNILSHHSVLWARDTRTIKVAQVLPRLLIVWWVCVCVWMRKCAITM